VVVVLTAVLVIWTLPFVIYATRLVAWINYIR